MLSLLSSDKDRELSALKRNHRLALNSLSEAEQQRDQAKDRQGKAEQEVVAMRQKNKALEQKLQASQVELLSCRDDLFRLQPTSHVPDSKISGQFNDLVMGICTWIDAEISRYSDDWQKYHSNKPPKLFSHGGNQWVDDLLSNHSGTAGEHVIRCMIQRQLYKVLFNDKVYLFDAKTIRAWRSEALTAIAASPEFVKMLAEAQENLATRIFDKITPYFPIIRGNHTSLITLCEKVIIPATFLAVAIHISPTPYVFVPRMTKARIGKDELLARQNLTQVKIIDAATGKTLKADSPVVANKEGYIGEQIALLTPSLYRCIPGEGSVRLTQAVILGELHHPLGRRRGNTAQSTRHQRLDSEDLLA